MPPLSRQLLVPTVLALGVLSPVAGLYEDQAGKVDWYRQQIGKAKFALFHSTGQQRLALVATEPGVVAGVDLRNGQIVWRQVLPLGEHVTGISQHGKGILSTSVSDAGAHIRLWGGMGGLLWDAFQPAMLAKGKDSPPPSVSTAGSAIVIGWQTSVRAYHGSTGEVMWAVEREGAQLLALAQPPSPLANTDSAAASGTLPLHGFAIQGDGKLELLIYESKGTGSRAEYELASTVSLSAGGTKPNREGAVVTLDGKHLVMMDTTGAQLLVHELGSKGLHALALPASASLAPTTTLALAKMVLPRMVLVSLSTGGSLLVALPATLGKGAVSTLVRSVDDDMSHVYAVTASKEGKAVLAMASFPAGLPAATPLAFETLTIEPDGTHAEWTAKEALPYDVEAYGPLSAAWLNTYSRKDGSFGHRLLLSSSEHSLQMLQTGSDAKVGWVRAEALASVEQAAPVPLPAQLSETEDDEARPSFAVAIPALVESLKERIDAVSNSPLVGISAEPTGPPPAFADTYGFRQAMLATTSAGKVFALHTSDGSVLWSRRLPPVADGEGAPKLSFFFVCRGGAHPQAVVVAQGSDSWKVHVLSPSSGKSLAVSAPEGAGRIVHAERLTALAAEDGATRPPVMLVDDQMRIHLYPDTEETRAAVRSIAPDLFFYVHAAATGALTGYSVSAAPDGAFKSVQRWGLTLPAEVPGQRVRLASFSTDAAVHSPVRVLGDRSVLHKYVNRNLVAVGVEQLGENDDFDEPSLLLMLVDTVSGRVVHSISQPGMRGPLTILLGENWLTWHYWNPKGLSYQMGVVELFTNSSVSDDPLTLMLGGAPDYGLRENGFDGFAHAPPRVLSQSYAFAAPVEALAVTQTIAGITPKFVLAATTAGQLVLLDKRFLDPRRPLIAGGPAKMSAADKEEGLVPYGPSLGGISPLSVATHRHSVARPRSVTVSPTNLESTSLALVVGLDLFMGRVAPAREFDRLNEDFNYVALVGAIIGLTVGTYVSGCFSDRKDLKRAWK